VPVQHIRIRHGRFRLMEDQPGAVREAASLQDIEGNLALDQAGFRVEALTAHMRKTALSGSALIATDRTTLKLASPSIASEDLPQILALAGVAPIQGLSVSGKVPFRLEMSIPSNGPCTASGEFDAAILRLGTLELTALRTPFRIAKGTATLAPLTFSAYGGQERGSATLAFARTPMGYTIKTDLDGVDVNQALSANTAAKNVLLGTGRASATVEGAGLDAGALAAGLHGTAVVAIKDGVVRNLPLLARINQVLKLTGGDTKDTRFESLAGSFALGEGRAHTEDLKLQAGELTVAAKGDIRFDLTLDFKGSARFSRARTAALVRVVGEARRLVNDDGELELPFTVTGPVSSPSVGVSFSAAAGRAVKQELKRQIGRQLQKLFQK
ncbi:MAG TPA: AsmA-like C-terminal region-containing protein, partial [Holophaga sp.]|nr:AsmA-like C-terminal region-containing protein [Holophaga sp.]